MGTAKIRPSSTSSACTVKSKNKPEPKLCREKYRRRNPKRGSSHCDQLMFDCDKPPALPKSAKPSTEDFLESSRSGALLMRKLLPLLAKMNQDDRNLILFMAGRVSKKQAGMKAGRKLASSLA